MQHNANPQRILFLVLHIYVIENENCLYICIVYFTNPKDAFLLLLLNSKWGKCKLVLSAKNQHAFQNVQYLFFLTRNNIFPRAINMPYLLSFPTKTATEKIRKLMFHLRMFDLILIQIVVLVANLEHNYAREDLHLYAPEQIWHSVAFKFYYNVFSQAIFSMRRLWIALMLTTYCSFVICKNWLFFK